MQIMAKILRLSRKQPQTPKTNAAGKDARTSSPPRAAKGLPHPRPVIVINAMMAPAIHRSPKDILPYLIFKSFRAAMSSIYPIPQQVVLAPACPKRFPHSGHWDRIWCTQSSEYRHCYWGSVPDYPRICRGGDSVCSLYTRLYRV